MSVVDTSPPAWYTYYPRPVASAPHPRDAFSMREKHSSPRKMVAVPTVAPCASPKQGSVYPADHHQHHQQHHDQQQQHRRYHDDHQHNRRRRRHSGVDDDVNDDDDDDDDDNMGAAADDDSADDSMMPFDLSRNSGSSPLSSPRSQRMSPAAFRPYEIGMNGANVNDQPLDLRVDHKKSRRGDELEDENQNLIIRTPSPEDIEVDSPGPPSVPSYALPPHHNRNHVPARSPCPSEKESIVADDHHHHPQHVLHHHHQEMQQQQQQQQHQQSHHHQQQQHNHHRRSGGAGITVDEERHHRLVNYPVLFPPQPLHPMMLEAMYRAGGDKSRLPPSLAGYQPGTGFHRSSQHYPFIGSPLLNGHHHPVPPPTYDVVRPPPPPPPPVARSPQQKSSTFPETTGKPKDR